MVKINSITRTDKDYERDTKLDIHKVNRVYSANAHPLQQAREFQRAVVATKIEKIFAKPFMDALTGHSDCVCLLAKTYNNPEKVLSASFNGEVLLWDLSLKTHVGKIDCFKGLDKKCGKRSVCIFRCKVLSDCRR